MVVRVLLFGPYADAVGAASVSVTLAGEPTCAAVREGLARGHPALVGMMTGARFAVNGRFADERGVVREADEVALIGLVSGG